MKTVLTIAGSDSGGGAGIQADLKTFAAFGVFGTSAITAVTAQNTKTVEGILDIPVSFIEKQIDTVMNDIHPRVWKTGMLSRPEIIDTVAKKISEYRIEYVVVDPVMIAKSGDSLLSRESKSTLIKTLIPITYIITPNCFEAEILTGIKISDITDMKKAAVSIYAMGAKNIVVKGGHLKNIKLAIDILYNGKQFYEFSSKRIMTKNTHGTGCTFASAIAASIAKGVTIVNAVSKAKQYIDSSIRDGRNFHIGSGFGPLNHFPKNRCYTINN